MHVGCGRIVQILAQLSPKLSPIKCKYLHNLINLKINSYLWGRRRVDGRDTSSCSVGADSGTLTSVGELADSGTLIEELDELGVEFAEDNPEVEVEDEVE